MQRRNVNPAPARGPKLTSISINRGSTKSKRRPGSAGNFSCQTLCSLPVLLVIAALLTTASYLFPKDLEKAEKEASVLAHEAYKVEQQLERDAQNWFGKQNGPPVPVDQHPHFASSGSSKWVDGEKRLKEKLRVLMERQQNGKDVGVPVLTRYLGEDVPAWPDDTISEEDWKALVEKKYEEMRQEEEAWKEKVSALLVQNKG